MSDELRIAQLTDNEGNPITPKVPASAVYVSVNGSWTNAETVMGGVDVEAVAELQAESLSDIKDKRDSAVERIEEESGTYRRDIDELSGQVETLDAKVFPLEPIVSITTEVTDKIPWYKYKYTIKEYGANAQNLTGVTVKWKSNDTNKGNINTEDPTAATKTLTVRATIGKDTFTLNAGSANGKKVGPKENNRYMCMYSVGNESLGANPAVYISEQMNKAYTTSDSFSCTVTTTADDKYVWLAVPKYLTISKVMSGSFQFILNPALMITVGDIYYNVYRSKNDLQIAVWPLDITLKLA